MGATARWDTREYQRIAEAEHRGDQLRVLFEDGSWVSLDPSRLLTPDAQQADWSAMRVSPFELTLPAQEGEVEVPWSTIRALTDRDFSAHLAEAADEQARQVGLRIRELREARGLSGKELAERAGITPQSLSRIEQGRHDVVFTTLQRILAAMGCSVRDLAPPTHRPVTVAAVLKHLADVGLERDFLLTRLLPPGLVERILRDGRAADHEELVEALARAVSRVFGWSVPAIVRAEGLRLDPAVAQAARFKVHGRMNERRATAYAVYAHYLALAVLDATCELEPRPVPEDPAVLRAAVEERYGAFTFEMLLRYVWDLGVPVVPLRDPGAFHGACWRVGGRRVIVLKQVTDAHARWLNDLGHVLKHVASYLSPDRPTIIEGEELTPFAAADAEEEREAREFATALALRGRAAELAQRCVEMAQGSVERLESACQRVAEQADVPVDSLASYLAWRISTKPVSWWGPANNLQVKDPPAWRLARDLLLERVDLERLSPPDRALLERALALRVGEPSGVRP